MRQCEKIKEISIEQADSMEQVEATEERIAEGVQNNSDVAQESITDSVIMKYHVINGVWIR